MQDAKDRCSDDKGADDKTTNCLKDLLSDAAQRAKEGEFLKTAQAKLEELEKSAGAEEDAYRAAYQDLLDTWKEQDSKIREMKRHLKSCYPDWRDWLKECVCKEVIARVWRLKADLVAKLGPPEECLDAANADLAIAGAQLEAWTTITEWISGRLELDAGLFDEISTLDTCKDRLFALYVFFFELEPAHRRLEEAPEGLPLKFRDPERAYCANCSPPEPGAMEFCGFPWLIDPDGYNCKLADVWKIWRQAGVAQVVAQCKLDQVAQCREEYEAAADPMAKRDAARDALRRCDQKPCPPFLRHSPEATSQQSEDRGV